MLLDVGASDGITSSGGVVCWATELSKEISCFDF